MTTIEQALRDLLNDRPFTLALPNGDHYDCEADASELEDAELRFGVFDGGALAKGSIRVTDLEIRLHGHDRDDPPEIYRVVAVHPAGDGGTVVRAEHPFRP